MVSLHTHTPQNNNNNKNETQEGSVALGCWAHRLDSKSSGCGINSVKHHLFSSVLAGLCMSIHQHLSCFVRFHVKLLTRAAMGHGGEMTRQCMMVA